MIYGLFEHEGPPACSAGLEPCIVGTARLCKIGTKNYRKFRRSKESTLRIKWKSYMEITLNGNPDGLQRCT